MAVEGEVVIFNPEDPTTYPSVCQSSKEVEHRFGFVGGERLLFDLRGNYIGQVLSDGRIIKQLKESTGDKD